MRKAIFPLLIVIGAGMGGIVGCDTNSPNSPAQNVAMKDEVKDALAKMEAQDVSLKSAIDNAYGYAIFPNVGEGAVGIGGAEGKGFVYQGGKRIGQITLTQVSLGFQLGGKTFAELIIFKDDHAFNRVINNSLEFGGDASATFVKAGAASDAQFANGAQVFILPEGGLQFGVSLNGQKFHFMPIAEQTTTTDTNTASH